MERKYLGYTVGLSAEQASWSPDGRYIVIPYHTDWDYHGWRCLEIDTHDEVSRHEDTDSVSLITHWVSNDLLWSIRGRFHSEAECLPEIFVHAMPDGGVVNEHKQKEPQGDVQFEYLPEANIVHCEPQMFWD